MFFGFEQIHGQRDNSLLSKMTLIAKYDFIDARYFCSMYHFPRRSLEWPIDGNLSRCTIVFCFLMLDRSVGKVPSAVARQPLPGVRLPIQRVSHYVDTSEAKSYMARPVLQAAFRHNHTSRKNNHSTPPSGKTSIP